MISFAPACAGPAATWVGPRLSDKDGYRIHPASALINILVYDYHSMSPRDRFHTALDLKSPDRLPLFFQHLGAAKWLLQDTGLRIHDGFFDPDVFARLSLASLRMYGFDTVMAGWGDLLVESKAHGMEWKFPERDFYPRPDKYVPMSEADKIQPVDPMDDPSWSVMLKAAKLMVDEAGSDAAVVASIGAPNLIASEIVGMENLMMGYFTDPGVVEKLISTVVQSSISYGERAIEAGIEDIFIENSLAGGEMVDPTMYEQWDRRFVQQTLDAYRNGGMRTILHNCSEKPLWQPQIETHPTAFHFQVNAVNANEVFSALRGQTCVMAGIDSRDLLLNRTPEEIDTEVRRIIDLWGKDPGFMVAPGCELPYKVPQENIKAFKDSIERHGRQ